MTGIRHPRGSRIDPGSSRVCQVAVVGSRAGRMVAAYELMELGLRRSSTLARRLGGRLRST